MDSEHPMISAHEFDNIAHSLGAAFAVVLGRNFLEMCVDLVRNREDKTGVLKIIVSGFLGVVIYIVGWYFFFDRDHSPERDYVWGIAVMGLISWVTTLLYAMRNAGVQAPSERSRMAWSAGTIAYAVGAYAVLLIYYVVFFAYAVNKVPDDGEDEEEKSFYDAMRMYNGVAVFLILLADTMLAAFRRDTTPEYITYAMKVVYGLIIGSLAGCRVDESDLSQTVYAYEWVLHAPHNVIYMLGFAMLAITNA